MPNILRYPRELEQIDQYGVFDDFTADYANLFNGIATTAGDDSVTVNLILASLKAFSPFVATLTDSGTAAIGDGVNGIMVLTPSDGSVADNDEVYLASQNELFKVAAGKPLYGRCRLQFTETTSGVYNAAFGFMNAVGANSIIDTVGGLKVSGSTIAIYKNDGETAWRCVTVINGGTAQINLSSTTAGGSSYQVLEIDVQEFTSTHFKVVFKVDGTVLKDSTTGADIVHTFAYASATEMNVFVGAKLGAATNNDVLNVDYLGAWQLRA